MSAGQTVVVDALDLRRFVKDVLLANLVPEDAAEAVGDVCRSNLRGVGHHDIAYFPRRLTWLAEGIVKRQGQPVVTQPRGDLCRIDGPNVLGAVSQGRLCQLAAGTWPSPSISIKAVVHSQHAIVIDVSALDADRVAERMAEMSRRVGATDSRPLRNPGERSASEAQKHMAGDIPIASPVLAEPRGWLARLGVAAVRESQ